MAYAVAIEKLGHKDGGPKIIVVYRDDVGGQATTQEIAVNPNTTDDSIMSAVKERLVFLEDRDAAFEKLTVGGVDRAVLDKLA